MHLTCIKCNKNTTSLDILLVNGKSIHVKCVEELKKDIEFSFNFNLQLEQENLEINDLLIQLNDHNSLITKLASLFGIGNSNKINILDIQNNISEKRLKIKRIEVEKQNDILLKTELLIKIYDYWPSRPPDWNVRSNNIKLNNNYCKICGNLNGLQVHHKKNIKNGGNHTSDNLIVLCEECHKDQHGGKDFSYANSSNRSLFSKKLESVQNSIENNYSLKFNYSKYKGYSKFTGLNHNGEKSFREILPKKIKVLGNSLIVNGHCNLRDEERSFNISRMSNLKIIKKSLKF